MEGISTEEIERMEDFIFHLSNNQMIDWKADLIHKQPFLVKLMTHSILTNKVTDAEDFLFRMTFIVLKCFEVYGIELPRFNDKDISKWDKKWKALIIEGTGELHYLNLERVGDTVGQGILCRFIHDKYMEKYAPVTQDEYNQAQLKFNTLNVVVLMIGGTVEGILKKRNNSISK